MAITGRFGRKFLHDCTCVQQGGFTEGTTMFELILFGVLLVVLIAALGLPYPQTTYGRWNRR
jgi:hypothetical protein